MAIITPEQLHEVYEQFNVDLAREILRGDHPEVSEEKFQEIWKTCSGNPWNISIMYSLLTLSRAISSQKI